MAIGYQPFFFLLLSDKNAGSPIEEIVVENKKGGACHKTDDSIALLFTEIKSV